MRVTQSLLLDEHLFAPKGWFLLDEENRRIGPVSSLREGLGVVQSGKAASVAGLLRPEAVVLDVDVEDGPRSSGSAIVEQIVSWCLARSLWYLVRPSGGAEGRHHVMIVPGEHLEDLVALVPELRTRYGVRGAAIDLRAGRNAVRPLSAPHRRGGCPKPLGDLQEALIQLFRVLPTTPLTLRLPRTTSRRVEEAMTSQVTPEVSVRRVRRDVDLGWRDYFEQGTPPVPDGDRSTIELMATTALVRAGLGVEEAWETVVTAHPSGMRKARERGWLFWIKHVWNKAVATDNAWMAEHAPFVEGPSRGLSDEGGTEEARQAVAAARAALRVLQWDVPDRARAGWLHVAHTLLDRMARTGETVVPCPERDLVVDTGLDRATIRAHLHTAAQVGLWEVVRSFDPKHRATSSHLVKLDPRFVPGGTLSLLPPPVVHTPYVEDGLWGGILPSAAHALLRVLPAEWSPCSVAELGQAAGLTHGPLSDPTLRQARTIEDHLHTLAALGLAGTADGGWVRLNRPTGPARAAATAARAERFETVLAERVQYREGGGHARWGRQRDAAHCRDVRRGREHFAALPQSEQEARRRACRARFFALPPELQRREKARLARRRVIAGDRRTEAEVHREWVQSLSPAEYAARAAAGEAWYASLDPVVQRSFAAAWDEHRREHGIERGPARATQEFAFLHDHLTRPMGA